ncbi:HEPN domain-containing protein [Moorella sulfitireducens]|uniref:HEPN domain-containing protein n=1 Tax=Neomoorella sulfitireducens TaxID=2972948 RepID=UPI003BF5D5E8
MLFSEGHIRTSVNRLYYACFYAVFAILLAKGYSSAKHSGIRSLFHQKIVKTGLVNPSTGTLYNRLFDARQKLIMPTWLNLKQILLLPGLMK